MAFYEDFTEFKQVLLYYIDFFLFSICCWIPHEVSRFNQVFLGGLT